MSNIRLLFRTSIFVGLMAFAYQNLRSHPKTHTPKSLSQKYGQWSLVVGASEGLGAEWAKLFCQNGLDVITIARREQELEQQATKLRNDYKCNVQTVILDLSNGKQVSETMETIFDTYNVGLMVYNAAVFQKDLFVESPLESHLQTIEVNAASLTRTVYAFGKAVKKYKRPSSGVIIMSSTLGDKGSALVSSYAATKAFDTVLAQSLANELQTDGIDVLACVAGPIETPNFRRANGDTKELDFMLMQPQDVANECLNALGNKYAYAPGVVIKVSRFFTRLLPTRVMVDGMSENLKATTSDKN